MVLSPDGRWLAGTRRYEADILIFDAASGAIAHTVLLPSATNVLAWSPDGKWLAASGATPALWRTDSWRQESLTGVSPCHQPAGAGAFSFPGAGGASRLLAIASGDHRIALFALPERRLVANLESPDGAPLYDLAFSRDHRWLVAGAARGGVQIWDLAAIRASLQEMNSSW